MLVETQYRELINKILDTGTLKTPSKGVCLSIFNHSITLQADEIPLLLGRKMYWKGIVGELKAFIANEDTVQGFRKHGCNFWGAWSNEDGSLDVDYARLLHDFNGVNQLERVITSLREKPDSRKHIISLWDPSSKSLQVPCVLSYQWYVEDNTLHMIWSQRSVDVMVGLASDMFSAWLLNILMANTVGLKTGEVHMQLGDCHIYGAHQAGMAEYLSREIYSKKPCAMINGDLFDFECSILGYKPEKPIKFELSV